MAGSLSTPETATASAHTAVESAARALARSGVGSAWSTLGPALEVQSAPAGPGAGLAQLLNLGALALGLALAWRWPVAGAALCLIALGSAWADLGGGRGWVRRLAPSRLSYTLIAWPGPLPQRTRLRNRLLIAAPLALDPSDPGPAARLALELARRYRAAGESELDVIFAWVTGGPDAIEVLLRNHQRPLAAEGLRVLCLRAGPPGLVAREGRLRPIEASQYLCGRGARLGLPEIRRRTLASRAIWCGVDAAALQASPDAVDSAWRLLQELRSEAEEGGWW